MSYHWFPSELHHVGGVPAKMLTRPTNESVPTLSRTRGTQSEPQNSALPRSSAKGRAWRAPVPVFVGEHPLAVFALVDLPIAKALLLDLVVQSLVEGADGVAGVLLVSPQVQL